MNFFTDNDDLQFHFRQGLPWDRFVPLWEEGFRFPDGPQSLQESGELYQASLTEVGEFAAREVEPRARAIDQEGVDFKDGRVVLPPALLQNIEGLKRLGVMAVNLPREVGGFNFPLTVGTALTEILSRACTNTLLLHSFYQAPAVMVLRFGGPEQIERWVRPLASGEISGAIAMTEPDAGSDLGALSTRAEPDGNGFRLTGSKQFITNGCGDVCVVLARSQAGSKGLQGLSLFVVPRVIEGKDNYRVARPEKKFVIRGSATCELAFDGSRAELLGPAGAGFKEILTFMNDARLVVGVQGLGIAEAALQAARAYAERRVQMGRPIARHELLADLLLDMKVEVAALRALIYRTTALYDRVMGLERPGAPARPAELAALKRQVRELTPVVKWFGAERTLWVTRAAVQVHGGYGVMAEYDVERHYRDALVLPIYEGTSQIQALMSLKDQMKWALGKPWRLLGGPLRVEAPHDLMGDALREMASEYNRSFRYVTNDAVGLSGVLRGLLGGRGPSPQDLGYAMVSAERLLAMLAYTRAAEALAAHASADARRRGLAERFIHRSLPLLRMHGEIVRSGDRSAIQAMGQ